MFLLVIIFSLVTLIQPIQLFEELICVLLQLHRSVIHTLQSILDLEGPRLVSVELPAEISHQFWRQLRLKASEGALPPFRRQ